MTKLPIIRTVQNSFSFVFNNFDHAVKMLLPIIPFMIAADFLITFGAGGGEENPNVALVIVSAVLYLALYTVTYAAVLITWHRAYLNGPSEDNRVDVMNMKRAEWEFTGKTILFSLLCVLVILLAAIVGGAAGGLVGALLGFALGPDMMKLIASVFAVIGLIMGVGVGMVLSLRYSLYFPAKATGNYLSFRESFRLSKGLGVRLAVMHAIPGLLTGICAGIYATIIVFIFHRDEIGKTLDAATNPERTQEMPNGDIVYTAEDGTTSVLGEGMEPTFSPEGLLEFIFTIPATVLIPLLCALVVANNLSQTYKWVVENRR